MVDVFEEVDEQLAQDKYLEALKKWGPWVGAAAVSIVIVAAGLQWWDANRQAGIETASDSYMAAIDHMIADENALADAGFDTLSREGTSGYRTLSLLQRASIALDAGDGEEAARLFEQAAESTSDRLISDLATIKSVWARWDQLSAADIEIRLSRMADAGAPYQHLARESIAAAALRDGDLARAESEYQFLIFSLDSSESLRRRAQEALAFIESRRAVAAPVETTEETPAETPVTEDSGND